MPQVVPCPACGQHLRLPDALLGKSVKCTCSHAFIAPLPATTCPVCGAGMTDTAPACPDCGYTVAETGATPKSDGDDKLNVCPNAACGPLNPAGERLCQRCSSPLPGAIGQVIAGKYRIDQALATTSLGDHHF